MRTFRQTRGASPFQSTLSMRRATYTHVAIVAGDGVFQSTLSMRRATVSHVPWHVAQFISIHALHEESDAPSTAYLMPIG